MSRIAQCLVALFLVPLFACKRETPPAPQWLVHLGTDAPLPNFGDRIRVDLTYSDVAECHDCTRVFDNLQSDKVLPLSFGVAPRGGKAWLRARLFRSENTDSEGNPTDPLIDYFAELPALGSAPLDVKVLLSMNCFGTPADVASQLGCNPDTGGAVTTVVVPTGTDLPAPGSWTPGLGETCSGDTPEGMVCVPGGLFLLGSRQYVPFGASFDPIPEQLVHLSPFFMDADEMTVGTIRPLIGGEVSAPVVSSSAPHRAQCSYTITKQNNEAMSVSCVSRTTAAAACKALGKRLPTEAEWEFAAGDGTLERPYPFALDADPSNALLCSTTLVARAGIDDQTGSEECVLIGGYTPGPDALGSGDDHTSAMLNNMGGNLSEWVADDFALFSDPTCWGSTIELRNDPRCMNDASQGVVKGGAWDSFIYNSHTFFRQSGPSGVESDAIGFRCAKDAH